MNARDFTGQADNVNPDGMICIKLLRTTGVLAKVFIGVDPHKTVGDRRECRPALRPEPAKRPKGNAAPIVSRVDHQTCYRL